MRPCENHSSFADFYEGSSARGSACVNAGIVKVCTREISMFFGSLVFVKKHSRPKKPSRHPEPRVDYGPREAGQHTVMRVGPRVDPHGKTVMGARHVTQRPLDRYLARGQITPDQFSAGMRFYRAWYAAGRQPVVCGSYNQKIARGTGNIAEAKEIARQEYQRARV